MAGPQRQTGAQVAQDQGVEDGGKKPSLFILIFIASIVLPNIFFLGPLKLTLYKLILLVVTVPLIGMWAAGKAGPFKAIDYFIFLFAAWSGVALFIVHGPILIETAGIRTLETVGAYLIARIFIQSPAQFGFMIKCLCWTVVLMVPFAIVEAFTSRILISDIMGILTGVHPDNQDEMRFGLHRVQGPFEHPILFGVFCASMTAPAVLIWGQKSGKFGRVAKVGGIALATFLSLSVGAYISAIIQVGLLIWDRILINVQKRWMILGSIFISFYVLIDLLSNRSPIQVFISYLTFNSSASYNRILIWKYGTAEVLRYPLFGIGLNDWTRPSWMVASIDNYWLMTTIQYGMPAGALMLAAFLYLIIKTTKRDFTGSKLVSSYRLAYLIGLGGFMLSLCTVHVWNATYVFLIFYLGSGVWMTNYVVPPPVSGPSGEDDEEEDDDKPRYQSARTRMPRSGSGYVRPTRKAGPVRTTRAPRKR